MSLASGQPAGTERGWAGRTRGRAELTPPPQCNSTGGDCFSRAYASGVTALREWYRYHYVDILALRPAAPEDARRSPGGRFVFSCRYDGQDCQAR